jgi:hypothetical protein
MRKIGVLTQNRKNKAVVDNVRAWQAGSPVNVVS